MPEIKTHKGEISTVKDSEKMRAHKSERTTDTDKKLISLLQQLPENYWDFTGDDTKEYTHGIHNYPAMMVSPISRNILRIMDTIQPTRALFDPFAGSGTVLVEGMMAGIATVAGNDINPLALLLSRAKTTPLDPVRLRKVSESLTAALDSTFARYDSVLKGADVFECSACNKCDPYISPYCPKCGAKMDVGRN